LLSTAASIAAAITDEVAASRSAWSVGFQRLDRQLELVGLALQLLQRMAELGSPVTRQLEAQLGDLGLSVDGVPRHRGDDTLQRTWSSATRPPPLEVGAEPPKSTAAFSRSN
jgi:hypothetical protein